MRQFLALVRHVKLVIRVQKWHIKMALYLAHETVIKNKKGHILVLSTVPYSQFYVASIVSDSQFFMPTNVLDSQFYVPTIVPYSQFYVPP